MSISGFSVKNPILVNMIILFVFLTGIYTMVVLPKEEMPAVDFGQIIIIVVYPGVSPEEIEELIVNKIENQIYNLDGVDYITSRSEEGRAYIRVVYEPDYDTDKAYSELNSELDKVRDLPEDAFDPVVVKINMREINPIAQIVLSGDFHPNVMREIAENLQDGLMSIPYISNIDIFGTRNREIWVEADGHKLENYGLTLNDIINAIRMRNMNVPAGTVDLGRVEFIVRTIGQFDSLSEIGRLTLISDEKASNLRIENVATIRDTLEERSTISKLDGREGVSMLLYKKAEGNIISVMQDVRDYLAMYQENIEGLDIKVRNDGSVDVSDSLRTLGNSALLGVILVFITLFIFLGWKNAALAAFGIPFSFLITFILMYLFDITMNNLSLFALVLVLGMIVDNAIVVIENVYRYMEDGYCKKTSAVRGANEVIVPVIASAATTAAAFLPLLLMEGVMGKFMRLFPIVVTSALMASVFSGLFILPSQLATYSSNLKKRKADSKFHNKVVKRYTTILKFVLRHRIKSVCLVILLLLLSFFALVRGLVRFEYYPQPLPTNILLKLETPIGTTLQQTDLTVSQVENYILSMPESEDILATVTTVGSMRSEFRMEVRSNYAQISIDLVDYNLMKYSHDEIRNSIRYFLEDLPGIYNYNFDVVYSGPPTGRDVEIRILGDSLERLKFLSERVREELEKIPGVVDISDSFAEGKDEILIKPNHDLLAYHGITVAQLAGTIRTALTGTKAADFRGEGLKEYDILVKMSDDYISDFSNLKRMRVRNKYGNSISIEDLADFVLQRGISVIEHRDRRRLVTITANTGLYFDNGQRLRRSPAEVTELLVGSRIRRTEGPLSNFDTRFPGYQIEFGGVQEEQRRSYQSLAFSFLIALIAVYAILATQFRSYVQPLIVMTTVPFAFIGVILGLVLTNLPFSLNTFISVVALAGVVVNNSLVLVDFINREREKGVDRWNSLINAGSIRLRPIILTTMTTIIGLVPMMLSTARSSVVWKPMAVSISFGLAFSTILTLFIIPAIYSLVDSFFGKLKLTRFKTHESFKDTIDCKEEV